MKQTHHHLNSHYKKNQQGAVLIIALIMLLILTLLGVAVMESSVVEERMAGNSMDRNIAFQAAEAGLNAGEVRISGWVEQPIALNGVAPGQVSQLGAANPVVGSWWNTNAIDGAWWTANGNDTALDLARTRQDPHYTIEEYDKVCDGAVDPNVRKCKIVYRVTAIAWGGRNSSVMLQSLYTRRF